MNNMADRNSVTWPMTGGVVCFFMNAWLAAFQAGAGVRTEIIHHSTLLPSLEKGGALYSLWYILQKAIALNSNQEQVLIASGYLLLGLLYFLKGAITTGIIIRNCNNLNFGILISTLLLIPTSILVPGYNKFSPGFGTIVTYIGDITPNTFMSATQLIANIVAIPLALSLGTYLTDAKSKNMIMALGFTLLAIMAKPGIAPGILSVWIIGSTYLFSKQRLTRTAIYGAITATIVIVTYMAYIYNSMLSGKWLGITTIISPMTTWNYFTSHPFFDLIRSWLYV